MGAVPIKCYSKPNLGSLYCLQYSKYGHRRVNLGTFIERCKTDSPHHQQSLNTDYFIYLERINPVSQLILHQTCILTYNRVGGFLDQSECPDSEHRTQTTTITDFTAMK